jgi:hypothetical protein
MTHELAVPGCGASPMLRDKFLTALDANDYASLRVLAVDLRMCTDVLPSMVCASLGLPRGSTYGAGARTIVAF